MAGPWTPDKMVTAERIDSIARALSDPETYPVADCRGEVGREGEPCRFCAERNAAWAARLAATRRAMLDAFGHRGWA